MIILNDVYLTHPHMVDYVRKDLELKQMMDVVMSYLYQRLLPLKDEIDKEEEIGYGEKATIIFLLNTNKTNIEFVGYSEGLQNKMNSCFSKEDFKFLSDRINSINKSLNN